MTIATMSNSMKSIQMSDGSLCVPWTFLSHYCEFSEGFLSAFTTKSLSDYLDYALRVTDVKPTGDRASVILLDVKAYAAGRTWLPQEEEFSESEDCEVTGFRVGSIFTDAEYMTDLMLTPEEAMKIVQYSKVFYKFSLLQDAVNDTFRSRGIGRPPLEYINSLLAQAAHIFTMEEWVSLMTPLGPEYVDELLGFFTETELADCPPAARAKLPLWPQDASLFSGPTDTLYCLCKTKHPVLGPYPEWDLPLLIFRKRVPAVRHCEDGVQLLDGPLPARDEPWSMLEVDGIYWGGDNYRDSWHDSQIYIRGKLGYGRRVLQYSIKVPGMPRDYGDDAQNMGEARIREIDLDTGLCRAFYTGYMGTGLQFSPRVDRKAGLQVFAVGQRLFLFLEKPDVTGVTIAEFTLELVGGEGFIVPKRQVEASYIAFTHIVPVPAQARARVGVAEGDEGDSVTKDVFYVTGYVDHTMKLVVQEFDAEDLTCTWSKTFDPTVVIPVGARHVCIKSSEPQEVDTRRDGVLHTEYPFVNESQYSLGHVAVSRNYAVISRYVYDDFKYKFYLVDNANNVASKVDYPFRNEVEWCEHFNDMDMVPHIVCGDFRNYSVDPWRESARRHDLPLSATVWGWDGQDIVGASSGGEGLRKCELGDCDPGWRQYYD